MELYFVTGNQNKVKEVEKILGIPIQIADLDVDEVQSMDLIEIASKKAKNAFEILKKPLIVEDAGFFINAWNGIPGPFIKFFGEKLGDEKILEFMKNEEDRSATAQAVVAYCDENGVKTFVGEVKGSVSTQVKGNEGWGFDFIFIPEGYDKTFAEMGFDVKNELSHRKRAFEKFKEFLDSQKSQKKL